MQERSLYKTIRDDLLRAIENGSLQPDQALPSERELCQRYGTSRMTVRHAVTELESLGSVYRMQGKGTFVSGRKLIQPLMQVSGFTEDMAKRGKKASSQILFAGEKKADAAIARQTGEAPTVLCIRATGVSCKVKGSRDFVLGEMLAALGCVNIADSDASLLEELSMEAILAADPERIFIVMQGSDQEKVRQTLESAVLSNPAWQQLSAVKNGRVYYMDQQLYNLKPNARWGEAYEKLAEILYGEA